ncbi:hypothetical protein BGW38_006813 [Lunasporangiospora selenospora]|uniref:Uncharacterized protein n=1 Tax=Lunasporangiospora selenospora TaxID=979761 RepID=A0A9P6KIK5_9FUNG|nr:hypothetical protein BGW38_006813 [Lunasporangiospora selenospora]
MNSLPGINGPLIGNGPGYKNGEEIVLPILPSFTKRPLSQDRSPNPLSPTIATQPPSVPAVAAGVSAASAQQPTPTETSASVSTSGSQVAANAGSRSGAAAADVRGTGSGSGSSPWTSCSVTFNGTTSPLPPPTPCAFPRGGVDAGIVVFSGGTACNSLVQLLQNMTPNVTYVLGISDNGGSTSEILRVLDGPAIGDIRSRLIRLIRPDPTDIGRKAIQELLGYRLPGHGDENAIKNEWVEIVEGSHRLWRHIPSEKKEVIRGFLIYIQSEILKRAHKKFSFANGSIGNFFLTGARMFFGSLESAIFLFAAITGITEPTRVIPVINTNHGIAIAASLKNGHTILGQCAISHPALAAASSDGFSGGHIRATTSSIATAHAGTPTSANSGAQATSTPTHSHMQSSVSSSPSGAASPASSQDLNRSAELDALLSNSNHPSHHHQHQLEDSFSTLKLTQSNIHFDKTPTSSNSLQSRISRLYYINEYGQEIFPPPNPKLLISLAEMETLVYSIGSLYTSIIPCLILKDVGRCIAESRMLKNKVFMLNGTNDRETPDYMALDFIWALTDALNSSLKLSSQFWPREYKPSKYITHLLYLENSEVYVDTWGIEKLGIECVPCVGRRDPATGRPIYDEAHLGKVLDAIFDGTWSSEALANADSQGSHHRQQGYSNGTGRVNGHVDGTH